MRHFAFLTLTLLLSTGSVHAQAFGVTPDMDPSMLARVEQLQPDVWKVTPPRPNSYFDDYQVTIKDKSICSVTARSPDVELADVLETAKNFTAQLTEIYGPNFTAQVFKSVDLVELIWSDEAIGSALARGDEPRVIWMEPTETLGSVVLSVERLWAEKPDTPVGFASIKLTYNWGGDAACKNGNGIDATGL